MGISQFPTSSGGASANYDFVVDMNDTTNNIANLGSQFAAGAYSIAMASGDTTYDVYLLDADGATVGYSKSGSIVATAGFESLCVLGVAADEVISFTYSGSVSNTASQGDAVGAGAYLVSISPADLPEQDDTATITGGNFSTAVEINFTSGTVSYPAKNIVRNNSTQLVTTRPDGLIASLNPWSLEAINPGIVVPSGSDANILADAVTGGSGIAWVTTSPLENGTALETYSVTLSATDPDGAVTYGITAGTVAGLSLNSVTGVLSGTPTAAGTATVVATDLGGNTASREFVVNFVAATGGVISIADGYTVHTFASSGDFVALATIPAAQFIALGGGGGGGSGSNNTQSGGGGGGGGLLSSIPDYRSGANSTALASIEITAGTHTVTIGGGGATTTTGGATILGALLNASGGGGGGNAGIDGKSGGAGGGGGSGPLGSGDQLGGAGTAGQGLGGGPGIAANYTDNRAGGGGGTYEASTNGNGGKGTHNYLDERGWGAGGASGLFGQPGGSSGTDQTTYAGVAEGGAGTATFGGGGAGNFNDTSAGGSGGSGQLLVR